MVSLNTLEQDADDRAHELKLSRQNAEEAFEKSQADQKNELILMDFKFGYIFKIPSWKYFKIDLYYFWIL